MAGSLSSIITSSPTLPSLTSKLHEHLPTIRSSLPSGPSMGSRAAMVGVSGPTLQPHWLEAEQDTLWPGLAFTSHKPWLWAGQTTPPSLAPWQDSFTPWLGQLYTPGKGGRHWFHSWLSCQDTLLHSGLQQISSTQDLSFFNIQLSIFFQSLFINKSILRKAYKLSY